MDRGPCVTRGQNPRADVGIVIQPRDQHLRPGAEHSPGNGATQVERERGHVLAEHDLVGRRGVDEIGHRLLSVAQEGVRLDTGGEDPAVVGVTGHQVMDHGIDDALRHLGPAGAVEVDRDDAVAFLLQRRELSP